MRMKSQASRIFTNHVSNKVQISCLYKVIGKYSASLTFHPHNKVFAEEKFLILMRSNLSVFHFMVCMFGVKSKNSLLNANLNLEPKHLVQFFSQTN